MRRFVGLILALAWAVGLMALATMIHAVHARDLGQWENSPSEVRKWFQSLKQPDSGVSCCGEGDGYYADVYHLENGKLVATITDERPDEPLQRFHVPVGTRYLVPDNKIVDATKQGGNPTGHTIVFLGYPTSGDPATRSVLCWVGGGGV